MTFSSSVTKDFLTYGTDSIAVSRSMERRAAERQANAIASELGTSGPLALFRHWLGDRLVDVGSAIAGAKPTSPIAVNTRGNVHTA